MSQILKKVRDVDPNNSDAIKEALSSFFQNLSKHTDSDCVLWLRALENVINRFPKYCMSQRGTIETYLSNFLDCTNYDIVIEVAKCAHALQQVRPTQEKTATAKTSWRDQMITLCNTAHALIGALFPHTVDIYQQADKIQKDQQLAISPLAKALSRLSTTMNTQNNVQDKQSLLCTRLRNVFVFLQAMLVEVYPVAKPIRPQTILDVIVRALSVSSGANISVQSLSDVVMVKTQALRSLDALVACLGPNLIPFSPLVFKFVMQTLKWSTDNPSEQSRKVRCAAYSSLSRWVGTLHTHRVSQDRARCWEDELTDHIIRDITPPKHVVELKMSSQSTKHLSKKAKRKLANTMLQDSNMASHMPGEKNKVAMSEETYNEVAISALECAETFLTVCGIFLKPTTHKRFQERLVRECYSFETYSQQRVLALLRTLEASRKSTPPNVPPPTQYCLQLYSNMINSEQREISNYCSQALLDIRMHLHCSPPSLNFAIEVQPEKDNKVEEKKRIWEKNMAALEALLGEDKVPRQSEEIITIADEPSNKRQKHDISDQISVSSESVKSVEISDDSEGGVEEVVTIHTVGNEEKVLTDDELSIEPVVEEVDEDILMVDAEIHGDATPLPQEKVNENNNKESQVNKTQNEGIEKSDLISVDKIDSTQPEKITIYEANTQMPLNVIQDDEDATPLSMEVAYDYPNTGNEKVTILEKLEGDNLPSSNETDDIQITCGQVVKSSQDVDADKKSDAEKSAEIKVNGIEKSPVKPIQNGDVTDSSISENGPNKDVTVEDMLADFVDEVNEDTQCTAPASIL